VRPPSAAAENHQPNETGSRNPEPAQIDLLGLSFKTRAFLI
jgi:hypothetical protein